MELRGSRLTSCVERSNSTLHHPGSSLPEGTNAQGRGCPVRIVCERSLQFHSGIHLNHRPPPKIPSSVPSNAPHSHVVASKFGSGANATTRLSGSRHTSTPLPIAIFAIDLLCLQRELIAAREARLQNSSCVNTPQKLVRTTRRKNYFVRRHAAKIAEIVGQLRKLGRNNRSQ